MTKGVAMANKKLVNLLLQDENANVANEEFETLIGADWVRLLSKKPQFADKCDCNEIIDDNGTKITVSYWHKLTGKNWIDLLKKQPQFVVKCNWNKIHLGLNFYEIFNNRNLADKIDITKLPVKLVAYFLRKYPEFAEKYDKWNEMTGSDWSVLLSTQPQFADKCDKWDEFDGSDWSVLLSTQPQFADKCEKWEEFENYQWARLLLEQPQFADRCKKWDALDTDEFFFDFSWRDVLTKHPQVLKYFPEPQQKKFLRIDNYTYKSWKNFCKKRSFEDIISAIQALFKDVTGYDIPLLADKLSPGGFYFDYYWLFDEFPEFIQRCNWNMLNGNDWKELLCSEPKFSDKCDKWNEIDNDECVELLTEQPQFADKCDKWNEFDGVDWSWLLSNQPQFSYRCNKWEEFNEEDWYDLLLEQPQLIEYCNTAIISEKVKNIILEMYPDLAKYFNDKNGK